MTGSSLRQAALASLALSAALMAASGNAEDYPVRGSTSVCELRAGSGMDIMVRYYSAELANLAGKSVVVVNKPGATGNIATEYLVRSEPDGYYDHDHPASATSPSPPPCPRSCRSIRSRRSSRSFCSAARMRDSRWTSGVRSAASPILRSAGAQTRTRRYGTTSIPESCRPSCTDRETDCEPIRSCTRGTSCSTIFRRQITSFDGSDVACRADPHGKMRGLAVTSSTRLELLPELPTMAESGFPITT